MSKRSSTSKADPKAQNTGSGTDPALFLCMLAMVLANLVFVQLTQAADPLWVLPLYVLTLASPFLARFKENLIYRGLWNALVVGFMAILVQHAMSMDLASVLQDGLLLAALSQVHLLNNLRSEQRPDLLFLNSFLIAIITGYITLDMGFALAFAVYAPFFIVGMQFLSLSRPDRRLSAPDVRNVLWDGAKRSAVVLGCSLLVFLFWPRDFKREAMLAKYIEFNAPDQGAEVGFSDGLKLQRHGDMNSRRSLALLVSADSETGAYVPTLWRGATLPVQGEEDDWKLLGRPMREGEAGADPAWHVVPGGISRKADEVPEEVQTLRITRKESSTTRLFLPRQAQTILLDPRHSQAQLEADGDGTVIYPNPGELHYTVTLGDTPRFTGEQPSRTSVFMRVTALAGALSAVSLASGLRADLPPGASDEQVVEHFVTYLQTEFPYRYPGDSAAAGSLDEFITTKRGGHCEFFASALVTMLRAQGIPSRVVTGFRSDRWDPETRTRAIYNSDAHAWVEVLHPERGWYSVDATPAFTPLDNGPGLWARTQERLAGVWTWVTGFDAEARANSMLWLKRAPGRILDWSLRNPFAFALGLFGVLGFGFGLLERRKRKIPRAERELRKALQQAGVAWQPGLTPREALGLACPEHREVLQQAVMDHERQRYAA